MNLEKNTSKKAEIVEREHNEGFEFFRMIFPAIMCFLTIREYGFDFGLDPANSAIISRILLFLWRRNTPSFYYWSVKAPHAYYELLSGYGH